MSPEEKIAKVLKQIRNEAAINPDPRLMRFELNNFIVGAEILTDEERRILLKLQKEGVIDVRLYPEKGAEPTEPHIISSYEHERFLRSPYYWVEILDGFDAKYENFFKYLPPEKTKKEEMTAKATPPKTSSPLTVYGDFISGDKVGRDKYSGSAGLESWLAKYWWGLFIPVVGIVVGFIITEGRLPQLFNTWTGSVIFTEQSIATSTVSLAEILNKALTLDTVVERQDFLGKYVGTTVFAQATVSEVSRSGTSSFLVDFKVSGQTVTCPQEANDDNEKQLTLLKGKRVQVVGKFPFSEIWGHGLGIDDCVLTRL